MKKGTPFYPYQGSDPYIFISYAHKDSEQVFDTILRLHRRKYRIWYDEGIEIGADWPQVVAERLLFSDTVLIFLSKNALSSQNCQREIHYAVAQKKKLIVLALDDCKPPVDVDMQLSVVPVIRFINSEQAENELCRILDDVLIGDGVTGYEENKPGGKKNRNIWFIPLIAGFVLVVGLAVYYLLGLNGKVAGVGVDRELVEVSGQDNTGEVSVTRFKDEVSMDILLNSLEGEYAHICGNCIVSDVSAISYSDGKWLVADNPEEKGSITKLGHFAGKGLKQLSLINENIKKPEGTGDFSSLEYLDLSGNPLQDLSGLLKLDKLQTLKISHIPEDVDLEILTKLPQLHTVYVSYDMKDRIESLVDAGITVAVVR